MKNTILAFGLLCSLPALGTDMLPASEENHQTPSKATRFQETFPEITELQGQIFGEFSLYFGPQLSTIEESEIPELDTQISSEEENTKFFLEIKREKLLEKASDYRALLNAVANLPKVFDFLLHRIEEDQTLWFTSTHRHENKTVEVFNIDLENYMSFNENHSALVEKLQENELEESVITLNQFSRHTYKAQKDYKKEFLQEYENSDVLIPLLSDILFSLSPEFFSEENKTQLKRETKIKRAENLIQEYNIKVKKQESLHHLFTLLEDYFLRPLQQFKTMNAGYPTLTDEEFEQKLQELRTNSENNEE